MITSFFHISNIRIRYGIWENVSREFEIEVWFDRAKIACDSNRGNSSKCIARYNNELHAKYIFEETLIHDLDEAIANRDLKVYYQPKYSVVGDEPRLTSAEALVRWRDSCISSSMSENPTPIMRSVSLFSSSRTPAMRSIS